MSRFYKFPETTAQESKYLSKSEVKKRGWTESLIKIFLPTPDAKKENPFYKNAAPMHLYREDRVLDAEQSPEFKECVEKNSKRMVGAKKAVDTKRNQLLKEIEAITIDIPIIDQTTLMQKAFSNYYAIWAHQSNRDKLASLNADEAFVNRIIVNYLRHEISDYEELLVQTFGKAGKHEALSLIRKKVYGAIAAQYPWLKEACNSQLNIRHSGMYLS